jgi:hypothetical protein
MSDKTMREWTSVPEKPVPLPDAPGWWIQRQRGADVSIPVFRTDEGRLIFFYGGRYVMDYDRGEWYGPLRLVPLSEFPTP